MGVISPTDTAGEIAVWGSAQRVVMARARAPYDAAVQLCLEYIGPQHTYLELEGSARSVAQFESKRRICIRSCVAYALVDLDRQVGVVVDVPSEVYKLIRSIVHLVDSLYDEHGGGLRHPLRA